MTIARTSAGARRHSSHASRIANVLRRGSGAAATTTRYRPVQGRAAAMMSCCTPRRSVSGPLDTAQAKEG